MPPRYHQDRDDALKPVAVIDIGSNSIRMVVYDGAARTPQVLFNEKWVCALGQGLDSSGRLNPEGVPQAVAALARFVRLARAMGAEAIDVLATAAVRDADDGPEFVAAVEKRCGVAVTVLPGTREALLSAQGIRCAIPDADGTVADLGGGSLELAAIDHGRVGGATATLPLGVLRLAEAGGSGSGAVAQAIDRHLGGVEWLDGGRNRTLFAAGGALRALGLMLMAHVGHPLHVLDNFTLERAEAVRLLDLIARQSRKSIEKVMGVSRRRIAHLPTAALVLDRLLVRVRPSRLVFSAWGMREGRFFERLPPAVRRQDPLIAACTRMAAAVGRFPAHAAELMAWMTPLFPDESAAERRQRLAACLLGDLFWSEHPDYRAEQAFLRVIRMPVMGLDHPGRAALALAVTARYQGDEEAEFTLPARRLLDEEGQRRARLIGLALRLAHTVTGGVPGLLRRTRLIKERNVLVFALPRDAAFAPDLGDRRGERLARAAYLDRFEIRRA